jgi:hypothetical protein
LPELRSLASCDCKTRLQQGELLVLAARAIECSKADNFRSTRRLDSNRRTRETTFEKLLKGFGYLLTTTNVSELAIEMIETTNGTKTPFDKVTVNIANRHLI